MPVPQLHVDAAVGWTLCFLNEYDLKQNPFEVDQILLSIIEEAQNHSRGFRDADSVTLDFHKMGWGHYPSSAFIVNRKEELPLLFRLKTKLHISQRQITGEIRLSSLWNALARPLVLIP